MNVRELILGLSASLLLVAATAIPQTASAEFGAAMIGGLDDCNHDYATASTCSGSFVCETSVFQTPQDGNPLNNCIGTITNDYCILISCTDVGTQAVTNRKCGTTECNPVAPF